MGAPCLGEETGKSYRINSIFTQDSEQHLYIFKSNGKYQCFKTGEKGDFTWLVKTFKKLKGLNKEGIKSYILKNYFRVTSESVANRIKALKEDGAIDYDSKEEIFPKRISKPKEFIPLNKETDINRRFFLYLNGRGISNDKIKKFKFHGVAEGKYENRVVLPMFYEKKFVYFTARDITDRNKLKYLHPTSDEVKGNGTGSVLFNVDEVEEGDIAMINEGPFNCFHNLPEKHKLVATNGKLLLINQFRKLERKRPSKYILCYDNDKYFHESTLKTYKFLTKASKIPVEIVDWNAYKKIKENVCDFGDLYKKVKELPIHSYNMDAYVREKFLGV